MKTNSTMFALAALSVLPLISLAEDAPKLSCVNDVTYSEEFIKTYPRAGTACREVVVKDGQKWIRFVGKVKSKEDQNVAVDIKNVAGDSMGVIVFAPKPESKVTVEGKKVLFTSLSKGDDLDFWIPESRYGFYADAGAADIDELPIVSKSPAK